MYTLMYLQATWVPECFITHITGKWTFPSMYMLMYLQMSKLLECSITHITATCAFHCMYPLVLFHNILLIKCSIVGSLLRRKKEVILIINKKR